MVKKSAEQLAAENKQLKSVVKDQGEMIAVAQTAIDQLRAELAKSKRPAQI